MDTGLRLIETDLKLCPTLFRSASYRKLLVDADQNQAVIQFPNPTYTFHEDLQYFPYKKIVKFSLLDFYRYTIWCIKSLLRLSHYGFDILGLLLRFAGLYFDLNALRKTTVKYGINAHLSDYDDYVEESHY